MTLRRVTRRAIAIAAAIVVVVVAALLWWDATGRIATVEHGRLYRGKAMSRARLVEVCRSRGIRTVIDLRKDGPGVREEAEALRLAGIRHRHIPSTQVPDQATVDAFLETMARADGPVLLHCRHGVGRTGVLTAVYRMERQGWSRTWARLEAWLMAGGGSFGPWSAKAAFLGAYQPAGRLAAPSLPGAVSPPGAILAPASR